MTIKRVGFVLIIFLALAITPKVFAQSTTSATLNTTGTREQQLQQNRLITKENEKEIRASRSATLKEERQTFLQNIQAMRQNAQTQFAAERATFQQKLETIKDTRRKMLVDQIQTKLSSASANRTNTMLDNLQKLSTILENIQNRANEAKAIGKDTSSVDTAIATAQTAIQKAQTAVTAQVGKTYIIAITATTSAALRNGANIATKQLSTDLMANYQLMLTAKQAVNQAYIALIKVIGTAKPATGTSSALPVTK